MNSQTLSLELIAKKMRAGTLTNYCCNRKSVWSLKSQCTFVRSLLEGFPSIDVLVREHVDEDSGECVWQTFDGNNRLTAIEKFMCDELAVPIDSSSSYHYSHLPPTTKQAADSVEITFCKIKNVDDSVMCDLAMNRNNGTVMSSGEMLSLYRRKDTVAARLLDDILLDNTEIMSIDNDRGAGVRSVCRLILNLHKHGVTNSNEEFKFIDFTVESMQNFLSTDDRVNVTCVLLKNAFSAVSRVVENSKDDLMMSLLAQCRSKAATSRASYVFYALTAVVVSAYLYDRQISDTSLDVALKSFLQTGISHPSQNMSCALSALAE
jgi:hypothetical protein